MTYKNLPAVENVPLQPLEHFPSRFHAAVFRMWETVSSERIAISLGVDEETIIRTAADMGLPPQIHNAGWDERGYITTLRNLWHILPYDQLLLALDWDSNRLATVLANDDFLSLKLGSCKPYCEPVRPEPLSAEQTEMLQKIKQLVTAHFYDLFTGAAPFDFFGKDDSSAAPSLPEEDLRIIYSFCGLYSNVLDQDISISYPDSMLKKYQAAGVNAIWLPIVLYQLVPFPFDESYSVNYEKRRERLNQLIERADKYNIKIIAYLNEPRCMPLAFFDKHPELLGKVSHSRLYGALCTSNPCILEYLRNAVSELCRAVPGIYGFLTITASENLTHCKSTNVGTVCPRCADIPGSKLVADVICAIRDGIRAVDPKIKLIAWTWAWNLCMSDEEILECIRMLPKDIIIQSVSEGGKEFTVGGVSGKIRDYSMSIPGPSDFAKAQWKAALESGREVCAKVQVNCTWECSTVPTLPVYDLLREHMTALRKTGVKHLMLSWTLGGAPSFNLKVASECLSNPDEARYDALLKSEYGEYAETVKAAAKGFSEAFREFPNSLRTLYYGPQNSGPANLLYAEPSGVNATMTCYAFDDIETWRDIYPLDVYVNQLKALSEKWGEALKLIDNMPDCEFKQMAYGGYALFRSSYLQTKFIIERDSGNKELLSQIVCEDEELALMMYGLMSKNPSFGYEAANHYYFNKGMLAEKLINCEYVKTKF